MGRDRSEHSLRSQPRDHGSFSLSRRDGQKVWTSGAHHADLCFCFVRTDADAPKHPGISVLTLDMKAPGVEVRPLADLMDPQQTDFTEVFLDGVIVPRDHLVGGLNDGWRISAGTSEIQRNIIAQRVLGLPRR